MLDLTFPPAEIVVDPEKASKLRHHRSRHRAESLSKGALVFESVLYSIV